MNEGINKEKEKKKIKGMQKEKKKDQGKRYFDICSLLVGAKRYQVGANGNIPHV